MGWDVAVAVDVAEDPAVATGVSAAVGEGGGGWDVHATTRPSRTVTVLPKDRLKRRPLTIIGFLMVEMRTAPGGGPSQPFVELMV